MTTVNPDTRIIDLTASDIVDLMRHVVSQEVACAIAERDKRRGELPKYVYGLEGIMQIYHCSRSTAARIKRDGHLDNAIHQIGRTFTIDVDLALANLPNRARG